MKTKYFLSIVFVFLFVISCAQTQNSGSNLNLDFENVQNGMPVGWDIYPKRNKNYTVSLDSITVKSGKYSIAMEFTGDSASDKPIFLVLPDVYEGKNITLSGYIKTENVTDGYAGLWMRIDPQIAGDNMQNRGVTGTTDWKKYEITLPMKPTETKQIVVGGMLVGKGKMWLDDLHITIDGKDIKDAKICTNGLSPAEREEKYFDVVFPELTAQKISDLELLGKIWGFLKYHHPAIETKNYNWDYELFRMLPGYLKIAGNAERDEYLLQWIGKYGEIATCDTCKKEISEDKFIRQWMGKDKEISKRDTSTDVFLKPDLSWIDKSNMSQKLKKLLHIIYLNRSQGDHYYINLKMSVGNPEFLHEDIDMIRNVNTGYRLLALYRYWNMIQYFYPYKYLTDKDWNTVLKEYIPEFVSAGTRLDYELTVLKLIGELDDSHAQLLEGKQKIDSLRGNWLAPVQVRFIENQLVVTKYYKPDLQPETGLKVGDIITQINGKAVKAIVDSVKEYYPASNEAARMRDIAGDMLRSRNQSIQINYISSNQAKQKELTLYDRQDMIQYIYPQDTTKSYKFISKDIGYVTLKTIKEEDIDLIKNDFKDTKGIIIDIRNYPSNSFSGSLESYFVSTNTPATKFTKGNPDNPGEFTFTPAIEIFKPEESYHGKLVVLVNEETQSQAEYRTMAFRAGDNTTIIGSQTAGADGNVSDIYLPGGIKTWISGIGVYYPDGRQTQRVGIVPDIVVKPTIKGIREGRDELLEKAIEVIRNN